MNQGGSKVAAMNQIIIIKLAVIAAFGVVLAVMVYA